MDLFNSTQWLLTKWEKFTLEAILILSMDSFKERGLDLVTFLVHFEMLSLITDG